MSEPSASGTMPDASAQAAPPEDPPAERLGSTGLSVVPKIVLNVCDPAANSGTLVLPITVTPARRTRSTMRSSCSGTKSANSGEPNVVRQPGDGVRVLERERQPVQRPDLVTAGRAPRRPRPRRSRARSSSSETIALSSGLRSAIRARCRSSSSRAEISLARTAAAWSRAVGVDREGHDRRRPKMPPMTTPRTTSPAPTAMPLRKSSWEEMPPALAGAVNTPALRRVVSTARCRRRAAARSPRRRCRRTPRPSAWTPS